MNTPATTSIKADSLLFCHSRESGNPERKMENAQGASAQ